VIQTNHPQEQAQTDALFRYQVVSQVLTRKHKGELRSEAISAVASILQITVNGQLRSVSERSIYRWLAAYENKGFDGLLSGPRKTSVSYVLPEQLLDFFKEQKEDDPRASIPELIRRAKKLKYISPDECVNRTTVWRSLRRMGFNTSRRKYPKKQRDSRRFAYPHRMDMVLCDGKHFRAGPNRLKRVALFFIDDSTRMILGVVVGTAESANLFLHGLHQVVKNYGLMSTIFLDNGPGFIAHDSINILKNLNILCIHGTRAYPEGHGKIERFNQTAQEQVLRHLAGNIEVDPVCSSLDLRLRHYITNQYNQTAHESLKAETPWNRFNNDTRPLRFVENINTVDKFFILHERRKVSKDNIISLNSIHYEMPKGYAGTKVVIRRNTLDNTLTFIDRGKLKNLAPVDLVGNARAIRACGKKNKQESSAKHTKSSADIAFSQELKPIVAPDGGFNKDKEE
jgi:putative transposase